MKINCSKWPYTSFLIPAYQKIVIAKKADFHARRTSRSAHDRLANILRTHAVWTSGERNAIMARGRLYNRNFGPRATITLRACSLMFYNRLSRCCWPTLKGRYRVKYTVVSLTTVRRERCFALSEHYPTSAFATS